MALSMYVCLMVSVCVFMIVCMFDRIRPKLHVLSHVEGATMKQHDLVNVCVYIWTRRRFADSGLWCHALAKFHFVSLF
jgi:hypothetical protein